MNNFQTILVSIFLAFFVFGVLVFSGVLNIGNKSNKSIATGKVLIWGTLPSSQVKELFETSLPGSNQSFTIKYVEEDPNTYEQNLIEAFAKDQGPDLFILSPDMILENNSFIFKVPYTSFSKKNFQSTFMDGADILMAKDGIFGYPLLDDPMVLYYNKNLLSNEGIVYPPKTWDELFSLSGQLVKKNKDGTINQAMIALGQYGNVNHAKDILSMLLLQSNNPIVKETDTGYALTLKDGTTSGGSYPFEQIVNFFLEFSSPSKDSYTWNRSLPNSFDMFTSGKLAFYIGYASELFKIESVNPNLSFDVTTIPQTKGMNISRTYGNIYTIVASKKSKNLTSALGVASMYTAPDFLKQLSINMSIPPTTRTLLSSKPEDPYLSSFFDSAIISHSWLDPSNSDTNSIFKDMIDNSISNKLSVGEAIDKASSQIDLILQKTNG